VRVLRYALGSALALTAAMAAAWPLAVLVPVLAQSLLGSSAPRPGLRDGLAFVGIVALACGAALLLSKWLLPYPAVFVLAMALVLFRIFHAKESGAPPLLIVLLLVAFMILPLFAGVSYRLAVVMAEGLVFAAAMTIALVLVVHSVLPDPPLAATAQARGPGVETTPNGRVVNATLSTLVVLPIFLVFHLYELFGALVTLVYVALLSQQPSFAANFKAGKAMLVGNAMGGVAAIAAYELLVVVPELGFLFLLTLLFGLFFGARHFSDRPTAPLFGMAFSTVLLIVGTSTGSEEGAGGKVLTRIAFVFLAVLYVVVAFGLIGHLRKRSDG